MGDRAAAFAVAHGGEVMTSERSETADDPKTVGSEFAGELQRCRELLELYRSIGSAGVFGAAVIKGVITRAEAALASGDVVSMVRLYAEMKECE